ncbi:MAG TPA: TRAP transporter small permease subunit [Candidatus Methylomirabilis sp.]|nr:TRAP transporter small permease subunit [Candidatus Methylomirabilis sp.]
MSEYPKAVAKVFYGIEIFTSLLLLNATLVIGLQVFLRYAFSYSLAWTEELCRFFIIWMVFIEAGVALAYGLHTIVEVNLDWLPIPRAWLNLLARTIMVVFLVATLYFARPFYLSGLIQVSSAMEIPMLIPYAGMFIGLAIMIVVLLFIVPLKKEL